MSPLRVFRISQAVLRPLLASLLLLFVGIVIATSEDPASANPLQAEAGSRSFSVRASSAESLAAAQQLIRTRAAHECGYRTAHQGFLDGHSISALDCAPVARTEGGALHQCTATIECTGQRTGQRIGQRTGQQMGARKPA